jgi:hypothetical protein
MVADLLNLVYFEKNEFIFNGSFSKIVLVNHLNIVHDFELGSLQTVEYFLLCLLQNGFEYLQKT